MKRVFAFDHYVFYIFKLRNDNKPRIKTYFMIINRDIPLNLARPNNPVTGKVVESTLLTHEKSASYCRHIVIDVSGSDLEHRFQAGQAFGVIPEWSLNADDRTLRLYSIASPTQGEYGEGKTIATTVKRVVGEDEESHQLFLGTASNYLCDLQVGSAVKVTGPTGKQMLLPDQEELGEYNYVFVATGTGIAPFRGMLIELMQAEIPGDVHLIFGVPYSTDVYYEALFRRYEEKYPNFHFYTAISREEQGSGRGQMYVQDRLAVDWHEIESTLCDSNTLLYICGNAGMEWGIYRHLLANGCTDYFANIPDELLEPSRYPQTNSQELLHTIRPNHERLRVEVY